MARLFPIEPMPSYLQRVAPLVEDLRSAMRLPAQREEALLTGPICAVSNLIRLVGPLPAAEAHHDSGPLGLVLHSIRVARESHRLLEERFTRPTAPGDDLKRWERLQTIVVLGGLAHDVAKILTMDVWADDHHWSAHTPLMSWAERHNISEIRIRHRSGALRLGPKGHEPLASIFLSRFIPWKELSELGRDLNDLVAALCHSLGAAPRDPLALLISEADQNVASAARPVRANATASTAHQDYVPGQESLATDFVAGFRTVVGNQQVSANTTDAPIIISQSHTVIFLGGRNNASAFRLAFEAMRAKSQAQNSGGLLRAFYGPNGTPNSYLPELALRATTDGLTWCVLATDVDPLSLRPSDELACVQAIRHFVVVTDSGGRNRRGDFAIIMRNRILWGDAGPGALGTFPGYVSCFGEDRRTPTCDVTDLGFRPFPTSSTPRAHGQIRMSALAAGAGTNSSVDDLESITARLVNLVDSLPSMLDADANHRWKDLHASIGERVPEALVQTALEAVYDRLRAMSGKVTQIPSLVTPPALPSIAAGVPSVSAAKPATTSPDVDAAIHHAICQIVISARAAAAASAPQELASVAQVIVATDGSILLPWPKCCSGLVQANLKMLADRAGELLAGIGLPAPEMWLVDGIAYRGLAKGTRGCLVPADWQPPIAAEPILVMYALAGVNPGSS